MSAFLVVFTLLLLYFIDSLCFCYPVQNEGPVYVLVPLSELYKRYPHIAPSIFVQKTEETTSDTKNAKLPTEEDPGNIIKKSIVPTIYPFVNNRGSLNNSPKPQLPPNAVRGPIGDIITGLPFFPIEINVPDAIMAIYQGISSIAMRIGQLLPFLNRFGNPEAPRPYNIFGPSTINPYMTGFQAPGNLRYGERPLFDPFLRPFGDVGHSGQNPLDFYKADPVQRQAILQGPNPYYILQPEFYNRY